MTEEQVIKGTQLVKKIEHLESILEIYYDSTDTKISIQVTGNTSAFINDGASVSLGGIGGTSQDIIEVLKIELNNTKKELSVL